MNNYELVVILDPKLTKKDHDQTVKTLEDLLGESIKEKDDMGLLDLAHHLHKLGKNTQAYFLSYHLGMNTEHIDAIKKKIIFVKGIVKYVFLKMHATDVFLKFKDLQEKFKEEPKEVKPVRERKERTPRSEEKTTSEEKIVSEEKSAD